MHVQKWAWAGPANGCRAGPCPKSRSGCCAGSQPGTCDSPERKPPERPCRPIAATCLRCGREDVVITVVFLSLKTPRSRVLKAMASDAEPNHSFKVNTLAGTGCHADLRTAGRRAWAE